MANLNGVISSYRRGRKTQTPNQVVVFLNSVDSKDKAVKVIGKSVIWKTSSGKTIEGKITKVHGNKGAVLIRFERGLPGQSLGTKIEVQ